MKITIVILKILVIGALFIVSNQNLYLRDSADRAVFYDSFYSWLDTLYLQGVKISGFVIESKWLPEINESVSTKGG